MARCDRARDVVQPPPPEMGIGESCVPGQPGQVVQSLCSDGYVCLPSPWVGGYCDLPCTAGGGECAQGYTGAGTTSCTDVLGDGETDYCAVSCSSDIACPGALMCKAGSCS